jgi:hypothetical protein
LGRGVVVAVADVVVVVVVVVSGPVVAAIGVAAEVVVDVVGVVVAMSRPEPVPGLIPGSVTRRSTSDAIVVVLVGRARAVVVWFLGVSMVSGSG